MPGVKDVTIEHTLKDAANIETIRQISPYLLRGDKILTWDFSDSSSRSPLAKEMHGRMASVYSFTPDVERKFTAMMASGYKATDLDRGVILALEKDIASRPPMDGAYAQFWNKMVKIERLSQAMGNEPHKNFPGLDAPIPSTPAEQEAAASALSGVVPAKAAPAAGPAQPASAPPPHYVPETNPATAAIQQLPLMPDPGQGFELPSKTQMPRSELVSARVDYQTDMSRFYAKLTPTQKALFTDPNNPQPADYSGKYRTNAGSVIDHVDTGYDGRLQKWRQNDANINEFRASFNDAQRQKFDELREKSQTIDAHFSRPDDIVRAKNAPVPPLPADFKHIKSPFHVIVRNDDTPRNVPPAVAPTPTPAPAPAVAPPAAAPPVAAPATTEPPPSAVPLPNQPVTTAEPAAPAAAPAPAAPSTPAPDFSISVHTGPGPIPFNADVLEAQKLMKELSGLTGEAAINLGKFKNHENTELGGLDGKFGSMTENSVKVAQIKLGMSPADGKITDEFVAKMKERIAELNRTHGVTVTAPPPEPVPTVSAPVPTTLDPPRTVLPAVYQLPDRLDQPDQHRTALTAARTQFQSDASAFYNSLNNDQKAMFTSPLGPFSGTDENGRPHLWGIAADSAERISGQYSADLHRFEESLKQPGTPPELIEQWKLLKEKAEIAGIDFYKPDDGIQRAPNAPYENPFHRHRFTFDDPEIRRIRDPGYFEDPRYSPERMDPDRLKKIREMLETPRMQEFTGKLNATEEGRSALANFREGGLSTLSQTDRQIIVDAAGGESGLTLMMYEQAAPQFKSLGMHMPDVSVIEKAQQAFTTLNATSEGKAALANLQEGGMDKLNAVDKKLIVDAFGGEEQMNRIMMEAGNAVGSGISSGLSEVLRTQTVTPNAPSTGAGIESNRFSAVIDRIKSMQGGEDALANLKKNDFDHLNHDDRSVLLSALQQEPDFQALVQRAGQTGSAERMMEKFNQTETGRGIVLKMNQYGAHAGAHFTPQETALLQDVAKQDTAAMDIMRDYVGGMRKALAAYQPDQPLDPNPEERGFGEADGTTTQGYTEDDMPAQALNDVDDPNAIMRLMGNQSEIDAMLADAGIDPADTARIAENGLSVDLPGADLIGLAGADMGAKAKGAKLG